MDERVQKYEQKMTKTLRGFEEELTTIRAGRANPHILDKITVDYYGSPTPIQQVANITVPEARMIQIQPWESSLIKGIEKAILTSDLGLNPNNDGKLIRLVLPELTEERRKELVKDVKKKGEAAKVAVRNVRRDANDAFKKLAKQDVSEDEIKDLEDAVQKLTDQFVKENLVDSYGVTSAKEMKKKIKDEIYKSNKTDYIWNHMIEKSTFKEIPDQLINDRIDVLVDGLKAELKSSNYSLKDYLSAYGIEDEDALREQYKSSCESTVKVFLVADAIAAEKKIAVTDDDIKEYFNGEDTAQYEKLYSKPYLNRVVLNDLVLKEIEKTTTVK